MELERSFLSEIKQIWESARRKAVALVNNAMVEAYWLIGRRIAEEEYKGQKRAEYGAYLCQELARELSHELGKTFDERELRKIRQFYLFFPNRDALRPDLTWTHYRLIIRVEDPVAREYYQQTAAVQGWNTRVLERHIKTRYFDRLVSSQQALSSEDAPPSALTVEDLVKDPYVMEFLHLDVPTGFSENDLETAIINQLQHFLLEMGSGFAFVGRQVNIKTDTKQFYIDLVFYNIILKAYVLIDLKISELTHQDIGQMDMYVRMWEDLKKIPGDNPTIGIILCSEKDATLVKYSVLDENKQLFASRYRLFLPSEEELSHQIQREKELYARNRRG